MVHSMIRAGKRIGIDSFVLSAKIMNLAGQHQSRSVDNEPVIVQVAPASEEEIDHVVGSAQDLFINLQLSTHFRNECEVS